MAGWSLTPTKSKMRLVIDYFELKKCIEAYTTDADVSANKLGEWRQKRSNESLLDLRKALLHMQAEETLWLFHTMVFRGKRYYLTRQSFGLNVVPLIMKAIVSLVLSQEDTVKKTTSAYLDDIFIYDVSPVWHDREHLMCGCGWSLARGFLYLFWR